MKEIIVDLFGHQAWADAEVLNTIGKNQIAKEDLAIRKRLNHLHQAHRAFLQFAKGETLDHKILSDISEWETLKSSFMQYHENALQFIKEITDSRLIENADIPWFKDPPLKLTVREVLLQVVMHTLHHRAQNITRLRELGGEPPVVDLIMWYWKGRPRAVWD